MTIGQINKALQPALAANIVSGKYGNKISAAGWNYAVLKFLIEKCTLSASLRALFIANANPKNGNYGIWRRHLNVQVSVSAYNALRTNCPMPSNSPSVSKMVNENTLKRLIAKLQKIILHGGINKGSIENAKKMLSDLGYQYDDRNSLPSRVRKILLIQAAKHPPISLRRYYGNSVSGNLTKIL